MLVSYQAHYLETPDAVVWPLATLRLVTAALGLIPLLLLAGRQCAAILRERRTASRSQWFELMFLTWSGVTFFVSRRYFPHYAVQAIPALVLLAADRLDTFTVGMKSRLETHAVAIMSAIAASFAVINGAYYWTRQADEPSRALAAFVAEHSGPTDQVLLWTWRPELLFNVDRVFATRFLSNAALVGRVDWTVPRGERGAPQRQGKLAEFWPVFIRDFDAAKPRLIIDARPGQSDATIDHYPQLATRLREYEACQTFDDLCVYLRKSE
jgi:hypothetical protein